MNKYTVFFPLSLFPFLFLSKLVISAINTSLFSPPYLPTRYPTITLSLQKRAATMSNPLYHEPEIQGRAPLELANPDVYERIGNSFNCVDRFIFALRCIMASPTRHFVPRIDVVSRRKERRPGPIWADRSLTIEFSAPDGDVRPHLPPGYLSARADEFLGYN